MATLNKHVKSDKVKWVITLLVGLLLIGAVVRPVCQAGPADLDHDDWRRGVQYRPDRRHGCE